MYFELSSKACSAWLRLIFCLIKSKTLNGLHKADTQNLHTRINHNYWQSPCEDLPLRSSKFLRLLLKKQLYKFFSAGVAKLVDVPDLGSGAARHGGSSPSTRTKNQSECKERER